MAISFTNYVNITSGQIASGAVRARQLITRLFTTNPLVPSNSYAEFSNANDVGTYFGTTSVEYAMAKVYFSFVSKTITTPQLLSFASYVNANSPPQIFGYPAATDTLAQLQAITNGKLNLQLGATAMVLTGINLSSAASLAGVASIVQTAIRAVTSDPVWVGATVTYDPVRGAFNLAGAFNSAAPGTVAVMAAGSSPPIDLGLQMGWESVSTILSQGSPAMTLTQTMIASVGASNNFASFDFVQATNQAQDLELAQWNATQNNSYIFLEGVVSGTAAAISAALINLPGTALTLSPNTGEYPELIPGMILAATDYSKPNVSQNYMFQQPAGVSATVLDDPTTATYDALRVNYMGQTQSAGQKIQFYQRGVLMGTGTAPTDMNVYANEIWLKSAIGTAILSLLLAVNEVATSPDGRAALLAVIQGVIDTALFNGTIIVSSVLSTVQLVAIKAITNSDAATAQVQTSGYWVDANFSSYVTIDGRTEYQANYTLVYTKNNAIRKVVGTDALV